MPEWDTLVADQEQQSVKASVDVAQVFAASYRKLVVQLYGIVGNASEAEDLVQEAFVRAYAAGRGSRASTTPRPGCAPPR